MRTKTAGEVARDAWDMVIPPTKAYCVECKKKRDMDGRGLSETTNECKVIQGMCPKCGAPMLLVLSGKCARKIASVFARAVEVIRRRERSA